ncbi:SH3 domain-containing protein [Macrococcus carouselicus]|uniref:SH3 domain-containing protein n=1 Tax=Macrococcus carouselicus TaxID=69969 RepID=UPI001407B380|nr:SH3 domain-containing protein [Macrococcus carouselicus]
METAIDYLLSKGWKISSDPRNYDHYPNTYGLRNFTQNGINYDSFCGGYHRAFDFYNNDTNDVPSVTSGVVITSEDYGNFGGTVEIRDAKGNDWIYGHLVRGTLNYQVGDIVQQGDIVGQQGSSNYYDNPMSVHLHLQLRPKGTDLNNEVTEVCSGIPIEKYDISDLKQFKKDGDKVGKKILLTAGHGGIDCGAVGNGTNERDFIREHIVDRIANYLIKAGHDVTVFDKRYDMLTVTFDGTNQHGLYWAKQQRFDEVIEFHLDAAGFSASGGHTIVWGGFKPDAIDTRIQNALANTVGVIRGISLRTDLGNARIAASLGVSYRLVELGFITSTKDMNYIRNNIDSFTLKLAEAIHGDHIGNINTNETKPVIRKKPVSSRIKQIINKVASTWKVSKGLKYKQESATFTCTVPDGIVTRYSKPSLKSRKAGVLKKGQKIKYDMVYLNEGYVWIKWTANNGRNVYMPVRKVDSNGNEGKLWGIIK